MSGKYSFFVFRFLIYIYGSMSRCSLINQGCKISKISKSCLVKHTLCCDEPMFDKSIIVLYLQYLLYDYFKEIANSNILKNIKKSFQRYQICHGLETTRVVS